MTVQRSPEPVWDVLLDAARYDEWRTIHGGLPAGLPRSFGEGHQCRQQVQIMGMPGEITWTVDQAAPHEIIEMSGTGPLGARTSSAFRLEAVDGGTNDAMVSELGGGPLEGRLGRDVIKRSLKAAEKSLDNLAAIA